MLVAKVRDVVGLNLDPPDKEIVLCVDPESKVQALARAQPMRPARQGLAVRRTHHDVRHDTTHVAPVVHRPWRSPQARSSAPATPAPPPGVPEGLKQGAKAYPRRKLHIVCANCATHKHHTVKAWLNATSG